MLFDAVLVLATTDVSAVKTVLHRVDLSVGELAQDRESYRC
jgi:hypothetical protein